MKKTLANYYLASTLFFLCFIFILVTYISNSAQQSFLDSSVKDIKASLIENYKQELVSKIALVEQYIQTQKSLTETRLRENISSRVGEAHSIATSLYKKYKDIKSDDEIKSMIVEALRDIRFNEGRGYFFIDDMSGICKLFPIAPQLEGKSLINFQDINKKYVIKSFIDIAKEKGSGFSVYYTNKYKFEKGNKFKKIAYVKLFEPYEWIIGTGEYLLDVENDIKKEIAKEVNNLRGSNIGSYINIFQVHNYSGGKEFATLIVNPNAPQYIGKKISSDIEDIDGKRYREESLKLINKKGEGFVTYKYKKLDSKEISTKLTYVKKLSQWDWVLSTGVHLDDLESLVEKNIEQMRATQNENYKKIFTTFIIVFLLTIFATFLMTKRFEAELKRVINLFKRAAFKQEKIKSEQKFFSEDFKNLANFANELVDDIHEEQIKLHQANLLLEDKVKEKTQELTKTNKSLAKKHIELERNYFTDNLTGLKNRNKFAKDLIFMQEPSIAIIDMDGFKNINDFYGTKVGDSLLNYFATRMNNFALERGLDTYRLSSDEFIFMIDDSDEKLIAYLEAFLQEAKNQKFAYDENVVLSIDFTCGIASGKDEILSKADIALNFAKKKKISYAIYDEENPLMNKHKQNIYWREKIQWAIENDRVIPYFQPIVDVDNQKTRKYEALIRIQDEDNIITPYAFLEVSKETKQYAMLTRIMIEKTFAKFSGTDIEFSINISILDIEDDTTVNFLIQKLEEYKVGKQVILEILETEEIINSDKFLPFVDLIRSHDVRLALDDFGSGYSNFSFLLKFPPKFLKVDGSLVKRVKDDKNSYNIVKTIVMFAHEINSNIVAEFVEDEETVQVLKDLGVNLMQGYHFSAPKEDI